MNVTEKRFIKDKHTDNKDKKSNLSNTFLIFLPVNTLNPPAQVLSDVHREGVIIQLVHLLQVLAVQHLKLAPLRHLLENKCSFMKTQSFRFIQEPAIYKTNLKLWN